MLHKENFFEGVRNTKIYYQIWLPPSQPKAIILISHGIWEHSGRYMNIVNHCIPKGYAIYALDHRGHGKSEGVRLYAESFDDFVKDVYLMIQIIKSSYENLPIFLLGHSMGSFIVQAFLTKYQNEIKGAILSGTGTRGHGVNKFVQFIAKILNKVIPKLILPSGHDANILSHDPQVVKDYLDDPLIDNSKGTVRIGIYNFTYYSKIKHLIPTIKVPVLIQCGEEDIGVAGREELVEDLKMKDKTVKIYPKGKHEIFNEIEEIRSQALDDLSEWLERRI